jgi:hypothetical protein
MIKHKHCPCVCISVVHFIDDSKVLDCNERLQMHERGEEKKKTSLGAHQFIQSRSMR